MEKPMGRCEGIVVSPRQNMSAKRAAMACHFEALAAEGHPKVTA